MLRLARPFSTLLLVVALVPTSGSAQSIALRIRTDLPPIETFDPRTALGAGVDGGVRGDVGRMLSPDNVRRMRSAGLRSLTYRLRTELAAEAWHWNAAGTWSDPRRRQGYWVSSADAAGPIIVSYGYRLPRRGNTHDHANDDGYSRLDDGDPRTFWKSNPYLDRYFTGEDNVRHPQWIAIDFRRLRSVNAVRLRWGVPYAKRFSVQYSDDSDIDVTNPGVWHTPPRAQAAVTGDTSTLVFSPIPVRLRYLRVVMDEFSGTAPAGSHDIRDRLGVAVRKVYAGTVDQAGRLHNLIRHAPDQRQTTIWVSSTDPWHRARDRDPNVEQPGLDLVFRSGLTNGLPLLLPAAVLYGDPHNAAFEVAYLKARGYRVTHLELGEEPEEQFVAPADYAALAWQAARAVRAVDPTLVLGGPSIVLLHAAEDPEPSWTARLAAYQRRQSRERQLAFYSFEWYPFDDVCASSAKQLAGASGLLAAAVKRLHRDGVAPDVPLFMTEYGFSPYASRAAVDLPGALLNAEIVAQFLTLGGARAYLYGYPPDFVIEDQPCGRDPQNAWGNNMLFLNGPAGRARIPMPTYYAARMLTQDWASPAGGPHRLYRVDCEKCATVSAFALKRPDGALSLLLINKDPSRVVVVRPVIVGEQDEFAGSRFDLIRYSRKNYAWHAAGKDGRPTRDIPPERITLAGRPTLDLPPYSLTVVRMHR